VNSASALGEFGISEIFQNNSIKYSKNIIIIKYQRLEYNKNDGTCIMHVLKVARPSEKMKEIVKTTIKVASEAI
jgi:hypothetical protein